jgi:hypothetical protein
MTAPVENAESVLAALETSQRRMGDAMRRSEQAVAERNGLVHAALEAGARQAEIMRITGLSRGRVSQLAHTR